jgi:hypothetical protein
MRVGAAASYFVNRRQGAVVTGRPQGSAGKLGAHFQTTLDLVEVLAWLRAVPDGQVPRDTTQPQLSLWRPKKQWWP